RFVMAQIGIYGANFKLAVFMSLFIQAYRFASEPLFFAQAKEGNAKLVYAAMMKYFVIFGLFIFLGIMLYLDIVKIFIDETYFEGLFIVPILLIAKLFFGIVFSLSIWYKVTNLTKFGIIISSSGLLVSLIINLIFIPYYSYEASSWAALFAYLTMAVVSYFLSRKFYKISYDFKSIGFYFLSALSIFMLYYFSKKYFISFWYVYSTVMFALFAAIVVYKENLVVIIRNRFLK
ncbi:MAG: polysaccharide biosynthesis C-terminal domain-containing protein, partial [Bacteroidales bacterium]|nr:polysaccharide biosynthesis C-terminal domain-containing protein [Bacteroidales bacterium]